jgi:hypothetical protein
MYLINKENIIGLQLGEYRCEITSALQGWATGYMNVGPHLCSHD